MHVVRAATLNGFDELVTRLGMDAGDLLRRAGLPSNALSAEAADDYLPLAALEKLYTLAEYESGQSNLAARLGRRQEMASLLGVLGLVMQQSKTVGEALLELQHYFSFQIKGAYINTTVVDGQAVFNFELRDISRLPSTRHSVEFALAAAVAILRSLCGQGWRPAYIQFMHGEARNSQQLERYFYSVPYFNQEQNAVGFAAQDLALPINMANPQLEKILHNYLANIDDELDESPILQVEKLIRQALNSGRCDIERVAGLMGIHRRTLHRLLNKHGTSYTEMLGKVRRDLASKMLLETNTSVTLVADILCYSSVSAFSRAFRAWFGTTPQSYRQSGDV